MSSAFLGLISCKHCGSTNLKSNGKSYNHFGKAIYQKMVCASCGKYTTLPIDAMPEPQMQPQPQQKEFVNVTTNKKVGNVDWRETLELMKSIQTQHKNASWSQDNAKIDIETSFEDIIFQPLSDLHVGSIATDLDSLLKYTETVLNTPNLYIALLGDLTDNFVNFRNMFAVHQQILTPEQQDEFIESWIGAIKHKVLFATWGNHEEFEEKNTGRNIIKRILKHNVIYMNGIGIANISINGAANYKLAVTHKTRYNSSFNITHGLKQLARKDIPDADMYIAGDTHCPAYEMAFERGQVQAFIKLGTLKVDDGYAKRYFSYTTSAAMPCAVLSAKEKHVTVFWELAEALKFADSNKARNN